MKKKVLFLCIKNSSRSQIAEVILNTRDGGRFTAFSAGSEPAQNINPLAVNVMTHAGFDMTGKRPKSLNEFITEEFDFIITLCDKMKEKCPVFPGKPILAHWGIPDPDDFTGTEEEKYHQYEKTVMEIMNRINLFTNLPMDKLDKLALESRINEIR